MLNEINIRIRQDILATAERSDTKITLPKKRGAYNNARWRHVYLTDRRERVRKKVIVAVADYFESHKKELTIWKCEKEYREIISRVLYLHTATYEAAGEKTRTDIVRNVAERYVKHYLAHDGRKAHANKYLTDTLSRIAVKLR